jgi:hypothetical protein
VADALTYGIELLVGLACMAAAIPAWRHGGPLRWLAAVLVVAGLAAGAHALTRLVT